MSGGLCVRLKVLEASPSLEGFMNVQWNGKRLWGDRRNQARRNLLLLPATAQARSVRNVTLTQGFSRSFVLFPSQSRSCVSNLEEQHREWSLQHSSRLSHPPV